MADTKLLLGGFEFSGFEIPENIPLGGEQAMVTHKLPGGARVVQAMGRDDAPIRWGGMFVTSDSLDRARQLDLMRVQGLPLAFSFFTYKYSVIIKSFVYQVERFYRVLYQIELEVISDNTQSQTGGDSDSLDTTIQSDSTDALSMGDLVGDSPLSSALSTMDGAIKSVSSFANAATSTINSVLAPIAAVKARVTSLIASATNTMSSVTTLGGVLPSNPISQQAARLASQVTSATQLPALYGLQSVVGRISSNIGFASAQPNQPSQTVVSGDLFNLAANAYGDAKKWAALAHANNLTDPLIAGVTTLTVPSNPPDTDGVYS